MSAARTRAREEKRRRIVDAAVEVFADKGFHGAKIAEIAEVAGVADGTIYLYFRSKDELLVSLFREKMAEILQRFQTILATPAHPEQKLRRYIDEHLALVAEQPKLMQILTVELRQSSRFMREAASALSFGRYLALVASIIQEGQALGVFDPRLKPAFVSRALFGTLDEISLSWVLGAQSAARDREDLARQLGDFFLRGLLAGPRSG